MEDRGIQNLKDVALLVAVLAAVLALLLAYTADEAVEDLKVTVTEQGERLEAQETALEAVDARSATALEIVRSNQCALATAVDVLADKVTEEEGDEPTCKEE